MTTAAYETKMLDSVTAEGKRRILRWDEYLEPNEDDMKFWLTYSGPLLAANETRERSLHVHKIRKRFHTQLKKLWSEHPVLANRRYATTGVAGATPMQPIAHDDFNWLPLVRFENGLICAVEVLMLREGQPGQAIHDIDNRLKTLFDAFRMARDSGELGTGTKQGKQLPDEGEDPFYVLLQDDRLVTHVGLTSDTLLEEVPHVPRDQAVRLVIDVTIRPYDVRTENVPFG